MTTYDRYSTGRRFADADMDVEQTLAVTRPLPDRVRWGAVWAGLVTAIAAFAVLQLIFLATDLASLDVNPDADEKTTLPFWTGVAGAGGFLLGGLVAGASSRWRRISDGILHGVVMWAVATVGLLLVAGLAAGSLSTSLGGTLGELADLRQQIGDGATLNDSQVDTARDAAASGLLLLGIMLAATVIGSTIGIKLWPRRGDVDVVAVDVDRADGRRPEPYDDTWPEQRLTDDQDEVSPLEPPQPTTVETSQVAAPTVSPPVTGDPEVIRTEVR
jgi:hypothetical protein